MHVPHRNALGLQARPPLPGSVDSEVQRTHVVHAGFPASLFLRTALLSVVRRKIEAGILHARHASSGPLSQSSYARHSSVLVIDPEAQAPPFGGSPWLTIRRDFLTQKARHYRNRLAHGGLVGVTATGSYAVPGPGSAAHQACRCTAHATSCHRQSLSQRGCPHLSFVLVQNQLRPSCPGTRFSLILFDRASAPPLSSAPPSPVSCSHRCGPGSKGWVRPGGPAPARLWSSVTKAFPRSLAARVVAAVCTTRRQS